jgi:hypothetical protein
MIGRWGVAAVVHIVGLASTVWCGSRRDPPDLTSSQWRFGRLSRRFRRGASPSGHVMKVSRFPESAKRESAAGACE